MRETPIPLKKADKAPMTHARKTSARWGINRFTRKRAVLGNADMAEKQRLNAGIPEFQKNVGTRYRNPS
jgi:hypothetical protein